MSEPQPQTNANPPGSSTAPPTELWEQIGFHKPVAGFWYNLVLFLVEILLGVFVSGVFMKIFFPFPESQGYQNTVGSFFALLFLAFDIGTNSTMERFISENRIKNPKRMVKFIQYFIWYQMLTGLVQVTIIAIYVLFFAQNTVMSYLAWIMLIKSITQYPGFLGVFSGVLNSLQYYDKNNVLNFLGGQIFQRLTEFGFVYLGKVYGETHPEVGVILGIAMGATLGKYLDDFITMAVSAVFFKNAMKIMGITARDCFRIEFDWPLVKEAFIFGLKTSLPGLLNGVVSYFILMLYLTNVPQYVTFVALAGLASGIGGYIGKSSLNITSLYAESYLNGKKRLSQYLLGQSWRYSGQMAFLFITIFSIVYLFLPDAFMAFGIEYYMNAIPFIIPQIISTAIISFTNPANQVLLGANKPNVLLAGQMFEQVLHVIMHLALIVWFKVTLNPAGLIFTLVFARTCVYFIKDSLMYWYVQKYLFHIKVPLFQTFVATGLSFFCCLGLGFLAKVFIYNSLFAAYGFIPALIPMIIILLILTVFAYFPLTVFYGGWDDETILQFRKVVAMSGPSKFIVQPMFKVMLKMMRVSRLHNRFGAEIKYAMIEAEELYQLKLQANEEIKNI